MWVIFLWVFLKVYGEVNEWENVFGLGEEMMFNNLYFWLGVGIKNDWLCCKKFCELM